MINQRVKIVQDGSRGHVYIDGKEIQGVTKAKVEMGVAHIPIITLDILASNLEIDIDAGEVKTYERR